MKSPETIEQRLIRIETRIVQLMMHLGLNPYEKTYDASTYQPHHPPVAKPRKTD